MHNWQMIRLLSEEYKAWFTGFFEGEGTLFFQFYKNKKGITNAKSIRLAIGQSGKRGLEIANEFVKNFGGAIRIHNFKNHPNWQLNYVWVLGERDKIIGIVKMMMPYLRVRKEEIENKLALLEQFKEDGHKKWTSEELQLLRMADREHKRQYTRKDWEKMFPRHTYASIRCTRRKLRH